MHINRIKSITIDLIHLRSRDENIGLFNGISGDILLLYEIYRITKDQEIKDKLLQYLAYLENLNIESTSLSLYDGYAGILYMYAYLANEKFLSIDNALFDTFDKAFELYIENLSANNNYDLLFGLIGIGIYYIELSKLDNRKQNYVKLILDSIIKNSKNLNDKIFWEYRIEKHDYTNNNERGLINLGMLHGMPSIVSFFLLCAKEGYLQHSMYSIIELSYNTLLYAKKTNKPINENIFSRSLLVTNDRLIKDKNKTYLYYCNGDFGIMNVLLQGYKLINKEELFEEFLFSIEILNLRLTDGISYTSYNLCHGWNSLLLILNHFEKYLSIDFISLIKNEIIENSLLYLENSKNLKSGILSGYQGILFSILQSGYTLNSFNRLLLLS